MASPSTPPPSDSPDSEPTPPTQPTPTTQSEPAAASSSPSPQPPRSKDAPRGGLLGQIVMIAVVLVICGGVAWWWSHHEASKTVAPQSAGPMPAQEVNTVLVAPSNAPVTLDYLGQAVFSQKVDIRARVRGFLESRTFEEGGQVKKGQVLFTIEQATFKASLEAAKAHLAQAEARYAQANREVNRFSDLVAQNAASQRELDDWKTNREVYAADIQAARAQIQQAQLDLDYTVITSPIDGVISQTLQDVGNYVGETSDQSLLAVVGQEDPIYVEFHVGERDLLRWQGLGSSGSLEHPNRNLSVEAVLSSNEVYPLRGKLNFVDTRIDPATGMAMMRAVFDNPNHHLKPGQFIRVKILGLERRNVLAVPQRAIIQSPAGAMVYVVDDQGQAQIRSVDLGDWIGDQWIVTQGLDEGDQVITNRLLQLRPGSPVNVVPAATAAHDVPAGDDAPSHTPAQGH